MEQWQREWKEEINKTGEKLVVNLYFINSWNERVLSSKTVCLATVVQLGCDQRQSNSIFKVQQLTQRGRQCGSKDKRKMCLVD